MEEIFRYRGMGFYFYEAVMSRDYTTVMAAVILFTVVTVVGLLIADFTYGFIDPRAGHSQRESFSRSYREKLQRFANRVTTGGLSPDPSETIDDRIDDDRINDDRIDDDRVSSGGLNFNVEQSDYSRGEYVRERVDQSVLTPLRIIWTSPRARVGAIILAVFAFMGVFGPYLVRPIQPMQGPILLQPLENMKYPLGTDDIGRDLFAQQVRATRPMLIMMVSGALTTLALAILLGVVSGYLGGMIDRVLMTFTDVMMNIPGLALIIVLAVILKPESPAFVGFILAIDNWPRLARQIRSQVLTLRSEAHVEASRVLGLPTRSILSKNVMSRLMPMLTMGTVGSMRNILMESVGLYFLGILPFTTSNWGVVLNIARTGGALSGISRFHWLLAPILFIVTLTFGLQLFAQGTDRLFNPRLRARHAATISVDETEADDSRTTTAD